MRRPSSLRALAAVPGPDAEDVMGAVIRRISSIIGSAVDINSRWATPKLRSLSVASALGTRHGVFIGLTGNRPAARAPSCLRTGTSRTSPSRSTARRTYFSPPPISMPPGRPTCRHRSTNEPRA